MNIPNFLTILRLFFPIFIGILCYLKLDINLDKFFDQYLRDVRIPEFEYEISNGELKYRWNNVIEGFEMPIEVIIDGENKFLHPNEEFKSTPINNLYINIDNDYYITKKDLKVVIDS